MHQRSPRCGQEKSSFILPQKISKHELFHRTKWNWNPEHPCLEWNIISYHKLHTCLICEHPTCVYRLWTLTYGIKIRGKNERGLGSPESRWWNHLCDGYENTPVNNSWVLCENCVKYQRRLKVEGCKNIQKNRSSTLKKYFKLNPISPSAIEVHFGSCLICFCWDRDGWM